MAKFLKFITKLTPRKLDCYPVMCFCSSKCPKSDCPPKKCAKKEKSDGNCAKEQMCQDAQKHLKKALESYEKACEIVDKYCKITSTKKDDCKPSMTCSQISTPTAEKIKGTCIKLSDKSDHKKTATETFKCKADSKQPKCMCKRRQKHCKIPQHCPLCAKEEQDIPKPAKFEKSQQSTPNCDCQSREKETGRPNKCPVCIGKKRNSCQKENKCGAKKSKANSCSKRKSDPCCKKAKGNTCSTPKKSKSDPCCNKPKVLQDNSSSATSCKPKSDKCKKSKDTDSRSPCKNPKESNLCSPCIKPKQSDSSSSCKKLKESASCSPCKKAESDKCKKPGPAKETKSCKRADCKKPKTTKCSISAPKFNSSFTPSQYPNLKRGKAIVIGPDVLRSGSNALREPDDLEEQLQDYYGNCYKNKEYFMYHDMTIL